MMILRRTLLVAVPFLFYTALGCTGKSTLETAPTGTAINTSVSGTPNASLFDVWTVTATKQAGTTCPTSFTSAQEEYLLQLVSGNECRVDDELPEGAAQTERVSLPANVGAPSLINSERFFDEEDVTCRTGGNAVVLQGEDSQTFSGLCSFDLVITVRLELVGEALSGNYELNVTTTSPECPAEADAFRSCKVVLSLSGQRGRHAPLDQRYVSLLEIPDALWGNGPPSIEITDEDTSGTTGGTTSGSGGSGAGSGSAPAGGSGTSGSGSEDGAPPAEIDEAPEFITFTDANLAAKVRIALGLAADAAIPRVACAGLTELNASYAASTPSSGKISNLSGLEHCTGLKKLFLNYNNITDLSPLASLTTLEELQVFNNNFGNTEWLTDLSPLSGLTSLKIFKAFNNRIRNLAPLASLTSLQELYIGYNAFGVGFDSLSPIAGLTSLVKLQLCGNDISDITPLAGLTSLEYLDLLQNSVSNLAPLVNLVELDTLNLWTNSISALLPLQTLHDNGGLNAGDIVILKANPIVTDGGLGAINEETIDTLESTGVTVRRD